MIILGVRYWQPCEVFFITSSPVFNVCISLCFKVAAGKVVKLICWLLEPWITAALLRFNVLIHEKFIPMLSQSLYHDDYQRNLQCV